MQGANESPLEHVSRVMHEHGAKRIIFKFLANNDNSKQQIYFGSDFDVLRVIPHGDLVGEATLDKGVMYKAPLKLSWIDLFTDARPSPAPSAQLIFYPRYPEVRMSGFLRGCTLAPSKLMQAPTKKERAEREGSQRCLVFGICDDGTILAYSDEWGGQVVSDANEKVLSGRVKKIAGVFYELSGAVNDERTQLISRVTEIFSGGPVRSCKLNKFGVFEDYNAPNGAGYTLESLFGIVPNGRSEPDFNGWELKSHRVGPITLMTPEPDLGSYRDDILSFVSTYGVASDFRKDFTGRHMVNVPSIKSGLTLHIEGYDPYSEEVVDPQGGLMLRDSAGSLAAGWTFDKILTHWSRKHSKTAYVSYVKHDWDYPFFHFGAQLLLCEGAGLKQLLKALYQNVVYHDPGINLKFINDRWAPKKRNQFRVLWKNIDQLYEVSERIDISRL